MGNPPYVEYSKVSKGYKILGYNTESCGNVYAFICERVITITASNSRQGLIVPISLVSTERMKPLQGLLADKSTLWFSNFDVYPSKLFEGAKQRLTIYIRTGNWGQSQSRIFSTSYNRWKPIEREVLFPSLSYAQSFYDASLSSFPKTGTDISVRINKKLAMKKRLVFRANAKDPSLYVHRIPYNYVKALNFVPYFWNAVDKQKKSEDYKPYYIQNIDEVNTVLAILNSNLFFWWWFTHFEGYHCGRHEILAFPYSTELMPLATKLSLETLSLQLMQNYRQNAKRRSAFYETTGEVVYDEFYPRLSKPIIDKIDRVLAQHYGFTDEELDYIINYDIKYRMGREVEAE